MGKEEEVRKFIDDVVKSNHRVKALPLSKDGPVSLNIGGTAVRVRCVGTKNEDDMVYVAYDFEDIKLYSPVIRMRIGFSMKDREIVRYDAIYETSSFSLTALESDIVVLGEKTSFIIAKAMMRYLDILWSI